jgi:hypothetical protein
VALIKSVLLGPGARERAVFCHVFLAILTYVMTIFCPGEL